MITVRERMKLASLSSEVVGKFRVIWKNTRKYTTWVSNVYAECIEIALYVNVEHIPRPKVSMEAKNE